MDFLTPSLPFIEALQRLTWLRGPMNAVSLLGNEEFFLLVLPLIYWCIDRKRGARLGLLLLFSVLVNDIFKVAFVSPRPFWSPDIQSWSTEASFGFPSGHAQNAALAWTFLASRSRQPKLWVPLALALVVLISFSRMTLGMHYPADVVGGALLGFAILGFALKAEPSLVAFWHRSSAVQRTMAGVAVTVLLGATYVLLARRLPLEPDASYLAKAISEVGTWKAIASRGGAFLGLVAGLAFITPFDATAPTGSKVARYLLGVVGIFIIWRGLAIVLPDLLPLRFGRYFLTTLWVTALAPVLFARIGLLGQHESNRIVAEAA